MGARFEFRVSVTQKPPAVYTKQQQTQSLATETTTAVARLFMFAFFM
jgi:hypothetical protein